MNKNYQLSDPDSEQAAIGFALRGSGELRDMIAKISADCFTEPDTKAVYGVLQTITGTIIDITGIVSESKKIVPTIELGTVLKWKIIAQTANIDTLAELLHEYRIHRRAIEVIGKASQEMLDITNSGLGLIETLKSDLNRIIEYTSEDEENEAYHEIIARALDIIAGKQTTTLSTFLHGLDEALGGGFEPGTLTVIGARPGTGKTALTMWWLRQWFKHGQKPAFISLEMSKAQYARRELSIETGVFYNRMKEAKSLQDFELRKMQLAADALKANNYPRVHLKNCDIGRLSATISELHYKHGSKVVVIDYLQRLHITGKDNKAGLIGEVVNQIKSLALQYDMAIILLSQMNRETAKDGTPKIHQLRDSGMIEEAADTVMLLHRPDMYGDNNPDMYGKMTIFIEKNRDGESCHEIHITADMGSNTFREFSAGISSKDETPY